MCAELLKSLFLQAPRHRWWGHEVGVEGGVSVVQEG